MTIPVALVLLIGASTPPAVPPDDVTTIDGIVRAFYDVVSGPAGAAPDRARDEHLHLPGASIGMSRMRSSGEPVFLTMDLNGYYERYGGVRDAPFYEWEIHRVVQRYGNIAQVWTTYATSDAPGGAVEARGINSLHLYYDGTRWWIASWIDERESPDRPIPDMYLPPRS